MRMINLKNKDFLLLSLLFLISYCIFLGAYPLLRPDEARYTEVAREMVAQAQFITPRLNGIDFFDKPILYYWLQASAMQLFGLDEWVVRLWPMLFGWLGVSIVFYTLKKLYTRQTAWIGAFILASSPIYYFMSHYANLDIEVAVLITTSLCSYLLAYQPSQQNFNPYWLYSSYIFAALAVLTKGFIGIVFPIMIIGLWIALTRQWFLVKKMRIFTGLLLFTLIVSPWFILVELKNPGFSYYFFYIQQVLRFITPSFNNAHPVWFYIPVIFIGMLPWIFFSGVIFKKVWKSQDTSQQFFMIWFVTVFVFFSIPHSKTLGYILPAIPPIAMLIGIYYQQLRSHQQFILASCYVFLLFIVSLSLVLAPFDINLLLGITSRVRYTVVASSVICALSLMLVMRYRSKHLLATLIALNLIIFNIALWSFSHLQPAKTQQWFAIKSIMPTLNLLRKPNDQLISFRDFFYDLPFYAQQPVVIVQYWDAPGLAGRDNWRGEFSYAQHYLQPDASQWLWSDNTFLQQWFTPQRMFVFVKNKKVPQLQALVGSVKLCQIVQVGEIQVVTNDNSLC